MAGRKSRFPRANRLVATAAALTDDQLTGADAAGSWRLAHVDVGQVLGAGPRLVSRPCRVTFHNARIGLRPTARRESVNVPSITADKAAWCNH